MTALTQDEHKALASISTVQRVMEHNQRAGGESSFMRNARGTALRLGHQPGTMAYLEFINGCLEAAVKHFENPNPDVKHGWFMVPVQLDGGISAEAHFCLDADDDIEQIEVWSRGQDLWPLLNESAERDVNACVIERIRALA